MVKLGRWGIVRPPTPALDLVLSTTLYVLVPLLHVSSSTNYPTLSSHIKSPQFLPENPLRKAFLLHSDGRFSIKTNSLLWPSEAICDLTSVSSLIHIRQVSFTFWPQWSSCLVLETHRACIHPRIFVFVLSAWNPLFPDCHVTFSFLWLMTQLRCCLFIVTFPAPPIWASYLSPWHLIPRDISPE